MNLANVLNQESLSIKIWEEDGWFVAQCLDIPGCFSQGKTRDEALANVVDAIRGCLEVIREDAGTDTVACRPKFEVIHKTMDELVHA